MPRAVKLTPFYRWEGNTLVFNILGRPNSSHNAIGRVIGHQLEVHAAAVPRRGGATAHMVGYLAGVFDVPKSAIVVVFGEKNVNKQLRIESPNRLPPPILPNPAEPPPPCPTGQTGSR